jgi:uncharacterized protein (TIGR02246 family)
MKDTVDPQIAKQIRALDMKYDEAFNKNDAAAVAARFTGDAVQVAPEGVFFGRQAIEKRYAEQVFQQWHCNNHITKTEQVIAVGNEICSVGEWSCNARDSDGSTKQVNGYLSTVFGRDGNTWKTRMTTFNLVPPAETK